MPMAGVAGQRLPGSSQPSQHRSEGAAGTSSSPSASFFQFPMGHQMLLPRCHLLGEMRRSKAGWQETSRILLSGLGLTFSALLLQAGAVQGSGAPGCTWCGRCGDAARAVTARDAHGCPWRRGKTASTASRRDLPQPVTVACAALKECFTPKLCHARL